MLVRCSGVVRHLVDRLDARVEDRFCLKLIFKLDRGLGILWDWVVLWVDLQRAVAESLLFSFKLDYPLVDLKSVWYVAIIRRLLILHGGQKLSVIRLGRGWRQILFKRFVVRKWIVHLLGRNTDLCRWKNLFRHRSQRFTLFIVRV